MNDYSKITNLIKFAVWNIGTAEADRDVFEEFKRHSIVALPADVLGYLTLTDDLYKEWVSAIGYQVTYYYNYQQLENTLPVSVPYVILKGSAAAKYYFHPEYRTMGDIDIITRREDFQTACDELLQNGYNEVPCYYEKHRQFMKGDTIIEVHRYFALKGDDERAKYVDDLIFDNISGTHYLPDSQNGIVLLEHIRSHLYSGLGLRQIIDWMMFAHKCLSDEQWPEFQVFARKSKLEPLAIITTRLCELYLGLPEREWCHSADRKSCELLMTLIMDSGNFGRNHGHEGFISSQFFSSTKSLKGMYRYLQSRGNWHLNEEQESEKTHSFAWLYQLSRYIIKGLGRKAAIKNLIKEYHLGRQRKALFDALLPDAHDEEE